MLMTGDPPSSGMEHDADGRGALAAHAHGSMLANISRRIVVLHKEFYGKGPTKARTYLQDDLVFVLLRGGFTRVEETLMRDGRGEAVHRQRDAFQQVMHDRFIEVIEDELGRKVAAFMSTSHQDPDLLAEIFVLESAVTD
jgi:uncharacterized protein YbcI